MTDTSSPRSTPADHDTAIVTEAIVAVAPDVTDEIADVSVDSDVFAALDLDSMDHLNVMTELATRTGIEVPERDYPRLRSIRALAERFRTG